MTRTIALLGDVKDFGSAYLGWLAEKMGARVLRLAEDTLGIDWDVDVDSHGRGSIVTRATRVSLGELSGVVCRFHPNPRLPRRHSGTRPPQPAVRETFVRERRASLVHLTAVLRCPVANRPTRGRVNASKPLQMAELAALGFRIPRWCVTNDPERARAFATQSPNGAIVKSCSGLRARVRQVSADTMRRLNAGPPVIVQERILGDDVRVHVVGNACFGARIRTTGGVDYRFDRTRRAYSSIHVPSRINRLCGAAREHAGLVVAGLDFIVTPRGDWFCLESNPAPTFLPYEFKARLPIGAAILGELGVK